MKVKSLSRVRLLATPWTAAYQAPLSMGVSRQEYWSGVPLPSPGSKWGPSIFIIQIVLLWYHENIIFLCNLHSDHSPFPPYKICTSQWLRDLTYLDHLQKKKREIQLVIQGGVFSSVAQLCPTLCDPMDCSTPGFPVHYQLLELAQTHVDWVSDDMQPSHPLLPPFLLPSIFPSIRVFSNESVLCIR